MIGWIARRLGYVRAGGDRSRLRARFDAASNAPETREHWRNADALSANAAADSVTRTILRNRSRYERFNNPFMCGQLRTLANDTVSIGPVLQLLTPNEGVNSKTERRWHEWASAVRLGAKLRLARICRACDGEVFIRLRTNPRLPCAVKLDLQLIEADQVATPTLLPQSQAQNLVEGIEFDAYDNPIWYYVLRSHPGDTGVWSATPRDYVRIPAEDIIHYFLVERPGQRRGIPEIVSSLNIHAERRNFRQSVLTAARAAASLGAALLETDADPDEQDLAAVPFSSLPLEQGMMTQLPSGSVAKQMKPEQPTTAYGDLHDRLITEQARPLNMPRNIASGDSSSYNFASGRLDHQTYDRSISVEQEDDLVNVVLTRIISAWCVEATSIPGYLPARAGQVYLPTARDPLWPVPCVWIWGERDHIDPGKEASAQETRLRSRVTTFAREFARVRRDWRNEIAQAAREYESLDEAGLIAVNPQLAPRIIEAMRSVNVVGEEATIEILTLLGVSRPKATRMVSAVKPDIPPRVRERMVPAGSNGNGQE